MKIFECEEFGGIVACNAPAVCFTDCRKYGAKLMCPTKPWAKDDWIRLVHVVREERLNALVTLGMIERRGNQMRQVIA